MFQSHVALQLNMHRRLGGFLFALESGLGPTWEDRERLDPSWSRGRFVTQSRGLGSTRSCANRERKKDDSTKRHGCRNHLCVQHASKFRIVQVHAPLHIKAWRRMGKIRLSSFGLASSFGLLEGFMIPPRPSRRG